MPLTTAEAQKKYGHRYQRYLKLRTIGDPMADAVVRSLNGATTPEAHALIKKAIEQGVEAVPDAPQELKDWITWSHEIPYWVDFELMEKGSALFERNLALIPTIVSCMALPFGYSTQAAKTLITTKVMAEYATKRLRETNRQIMEVSLIDGLKPGRPGWQTSLMVRMIHAIIRNQIATTTPWDHATYGAPLNNVHLSMLTAVMGSYIVEGLKKVHRDMTEEEADGYVSIWRYAGYLMGVDPELAVTDHVEGMRHLEFLFDLELDPGEDSIELIHQLFECVGPVGEIIDPAQCKRLTEITMSLAREFMGNDLADKLRFPAGHPHFTHAAFVALIKSQNFIEHFIPSIGKDIRDYQFKLFHQMSLYSGDDVLDAFPLPSKIGDN